MPKPNPTFSTFPCGIQFFAPPFRTLYLVPWIALAVILLAIDIALDRAFGRVNMKVGPWATCSLYAVNAMIFGTIFTAAGVLVRYSSSTTLNRLQPGHWLIINSATVGCLGLLFAPFWRYEGKESGLLMASVGVCSLVSATIFWLAAARLPATGRWKSAFWIFAVMHMLGAAASLFFFFPKNELSGFFILVPIALLSAGVICAIIAILSFLSAVVTDLRTKCHRDWLHWLGVASVVIGPLTHAAWQIAGYFALP